MIKYIVGLVLAVVVTVVVTVAISVAVAIPIAKQNAEAAAAAPVAREAGYMYSLTGNDKSKYLTTTLVDGKIVCLQLVQEVDAALAPKDQKNLDRKMLVLQDTLLRALRELKSNDLAAGNQEVFKRRIREVASKVLGRHAVLGVYLIGSTVEVSELDPAPTTMMIKGYDCS